MNTERYESPLDAYLDGQMTPEQRTAFEQKIAADPELQAAVSLQREIDASLLRNFEPPQVATPSAPPVTLRAWWRRPELLAVAATVAVAAIGLWRWYGHDLTPHERYWQSSPHAMTTVYRYEMATDYRADWVCENDQQFAGSIWARFGQPLVLGVLPSGSEAIGLSYANTMSPDGMHLLARVDGRPVLVFIERAAVGGDQSISGLERLRTGLRLFSRTLGDLVLHEVTPHDRPRVLDHFSIPDADEGWLREGARALGIRVDGN